MNELPDDNADEAREVSRLYKNDPTTANYVALRRKFPHVAIEIGVIGGIDPLFAMREELERNGISADLMASAFDADPIAISKISLTLLERMIDAEKLRSEGQTSLIRRKLEIPTMLIDWIIACCLDALSWNDDLYIPRDLIVLIRERLGGTNNLYRRKFEAYRSKWNVIMTAARLKAQNQECTYRELGRAFGVAPSTVKRWFAPGEFERERDQMARHFDEQGKFSMIPFGEKLDRDALLARLKSQTKD